MIDRISRRYLLFLLGVSPLIAGEFWKKEAVAWSAEEVDKMLNDSPWAKSITPKFDRSATGGIGGQGGGGIGLPGIGVGMPGGGMGMPGGGRGGGMGMPGGSRGGSGGPGGERTGTADRSVLVRWSSALPIRQALLAKRFGPDEMTSSSVRLQMEAEPENQPDHYELELLGLSINSMRAGEDRMIAELHATTALHRKGKHPLSAETIELMPNEGAVNVVFRFPKHDPIDLHDKDVEFISSIGPVKIRQKFKLRKMVYQGGLEL